MYKTYLSLILWDKFNDSYISQKLNVQQRGLWMIEMIYANKNELIQNYACSM